MTPRGVAEASLEKHSTFVSLHNVKVWDDQLKFAQASTPAPTASNVRPLLPRHSIVDLSASCSLPKSDAASAQRVVASKRRPSASAKVLRCGSVSSSNREPLPAHSGAITDFKPFEGGGNAPSITYVVFREFQSRSCPVYEPVVTLKALSILRPLFYHCIRYLEDNHAELQRKLSSVPLRSRNASSLAPAEGPRTSSPTPNDTSSPMRLTTDIDMTDDIRNPAIEQSCSLIKCQDSNVKIRNESLVVESILHDLKDLSSIFYQKMRQLEQNDDLLMRLIRAIELEHSRLYEFQLHWSLLHSSSPIPASDTTTPAPKSKLLPPWPTKMLQRLETLESARSRVEELENKGSRLCESLDSTLTSRPFSSSVSNFSNSCMTNKKGDGDAAPRSYSATSPPTPSDNGGVEEASRRTQPLMSAPDNSVASWPACPTSCLTDPPHRITDQTPDQIIRTKAAAAAAAATTSSSSTVSEHWTDAVTTPSLLLSPTSTIIPASSSLTTSQSKSSVFSPPAPALPKPLLCQDLKLTSGSPPNSDSVVN